jgi:uncharacterized SAM-binding protein YcdF (DUF218 family)
LRRAVTTLGLLVAGAAFALLAGFVVFAASISRFGSEGAVVLAQNPADGIVVLTGGALRVSEGLKLFEHAEAKRILISGVNRRTSREDLQRRTGLPQTLFDCCVDVGREALDTSGNAAETRAWASTWGFKRLAVVTSHYHMPRGLAELARALPHVELVPYSVVAQAYPTERWWMNAGAIRIAMIEYVKFLPSVARLGVERVIARSEPMVDLSATQDQSALSRVKP